MANISSVHNKLMLRLAARFLMLLILMTSLGVVAEEGASYSYEFLYTGNPLVSHVSSADPDAHVWDDTVWVYTSTDGNLLEYGYNGQDDEWTYAHMDGYRAFSSTDLLHWTDHGEILHSRDVAWGNAGWMWAPGAARRNGTYYLYFPHRVRVAVHCCCSVLFVCSD